MMGVTTVTGERRSAKEKGVGRGREEETPRMLPCVLDLLPCLFGLTVRRSHDRRRTVESIRGDPFLSTQSRVGRFVVWRVRDDRISAMGRYHSSFFRSNQSRGSKQSITRVETVFEGKAQVVAVAARIYRSGSWAGTHWRRRRRDWGSKKANLCSSGLCQSVLAEVILIEQWRS